MIPLSLAEAATILGGVLHDAPDPEARITGPVVHDSRRIEPGALFAAIAGERVDGHDFAAQAVADGAAAVLAMRPVGVPAIVVDDTVKALGRLARGVVDRLPQATVVALTGSAGKTSTKDMIGQLLTRLGPTVFPAGSFNNEIGHPLTALRADEQTRHLVMEMGAAHKGDIAYLCGITPPKVSVVLNVGTAHIGEFGGQDAIAEAKSEIVQALPDDGVAILNADDFRVRAMADKTRARVVYYGESPEATVRAEEIALDDKGRPGFTLITPEGRAHVQLKLVGDHQVANALAAATAARELGMGLAELALGLSEAEALSRWRMEVRERADGVTIVNDAYNANPASMRAALRSVAVMARSRPEAHSYAVLGPMLELGDDTMAEHDALGRLVVRLNIGTLVAVGGREAEWMELGARNEGSWNEESVQVTDAQAAIDLLRDRLRPGDVVLVKASRGIGLERVAEALLADGAGSADTTPGAAR
ncbi:UDP-N-acetylmuramoyl-tripeptide--D-alanyl-D-alanine ligase [Mangrovactinospora gilvigrisea]|uniref:UDP-N-acetylmuramoyl-tripeptide--D-alanyl-D-alanine ligase n=1 Tax=Mangrovactinospora gilvigrisea TaxID=1428644 RepID=A0A1J7BHV4_9ACTN|nr:UDP-N-acetylmuramoyl-tripeptide--D-alanyl-D-alanine ligase [Mangrovactinospora gilvigrisea]OIV38165.1 UDP-N-acetylmuramoyl-tripeptide--D-alanyl-D-alanine ligase [Mangrovactinospora gilvigrisea]